MTPTPTPTATPTPTPTATSTPTPTPTSNSTSTPNPATDPPAPRFGRAASFAVVAVVYLVALAVAVAVAAWLGGAPLWQRVAAADLAATLVVFAASVLLDNSSCYDPYWSVAPVVVALWLALDAGAAADGGRRALLTAVVAAWGLRLTWNWVRGWPGLHHEDWRYAERRTGRAYWLVSFVGFHFMPTVTVALGMLAFLPALSTSRAPLGWLDAVAALVAGGAVLLEATADRQLRAFRRAGPPSGTILATGVWSWCRHPNYLGEVGLWWGVWLFGLAADPHAWWWTLAGPAWMTGLFVGISIPLIERRMRRRPGWAAHAARVPALLPRPWRRG